MRTRTVPLGSWLCSTRMRNGAAPRSLEETHHARGSRLRRPRTYSCSIELKRANGSHMTECLTLSFHFAL